MGVLCSSNITSRTKATEIRGMHIKKIFTTCLTPAMSAAESAGG